MIPSAASAVASVPTVNGISLGDVISNMESELQDANQPPTKKAATAAKGAKKPLPKLKLVKK